MSQPIEIEGKTYTPNLVPCKMVEIKYLEEDSSREWIKKRMELCAGRIRRETSHDGTERADPVGVRQ